MGCLNSTGQFSHWFGNIHLSGPCNRKCYFCVGQHMMALDGYNNLDQKKLNGIDEFLDECNERNIKEVNLTGTNTDPLLYNHHEDLCKYIRERIDGAVIGIRTNAASIERWQKFIPFYDKASISITSFNTDLYKITMGCGEPPDIKSLQKTNISDLKANVVLCPETRIDVLDTVLKLSSFGIKRINLREPYGQPTVGNPFSEIREPDCYTLGMPSYKVGNSFVTYWDVHYVEVESVNLYASGRVSIDYPITRGHDDSGSVFDQTEWKHGRHNEQWVTPTIKTT